MEIGDEENGKLEEVGNRFVPEERLGEMEEEKAFSRMRGRVHKRECEGWIKKVKLSKFVE